MSNTLHVCFTLTSFHTCFIKTCATSQHNVAVRYTYVFVEASKIVDKPSVVIIVLFKHKITVRVHGVRHTYTNASYCRIMNTTVSMNSSNGNVTL